MTLIVDGTRCMSVIYGVIFEIVTNLQTSGGQKQRPF